MRLGNIFQPKLWIQVTGCFRLQICKLFLSLWHFSSVISSLPLREGGSHNVTNVRAGHTRGHSPLSWWDSGDAEDPTRSGRSSMVTIWSLCSDGHCMVSASWLSLFSSHSLCTLKLTLTEISFLKQHLPLTSNCLLNIPGDSCSLAESWAVTGAGACALYCAVQSAVHSTDARCRLGRHNDRDQSLV